MIIRNWISPHFFWEKHNVLRRRYLPVGLFDWFDELLLASLLLLLFRLLQSVKVDGSHGPGDFDIGNTQLVPVLDKSGNAYCGKSSIENVS